MFKLAKGTPEIPSDQFCVSFDYLDASMWGLVEWMKKKERKKEEKKAFF